MDKLSVEETRDLLISFLFVLRHVDPLVLLQWWRDSASSRNPSRLGEFEDPATSRLSQIINFFNVLESVALSDLHHKSLVLLFFQNLFVCFQVLREDGS